MEVTASIDKENNTNIWGNFPSEGQLWEDHDVVLPVV